MSLNDGSKMSFLMKLFNSLNQVISSDDLVGFVGTIQI